MNSAARRKLGGARDIGIVASGSAEADVVGDRGAEDRDILRHQRDAAAQFARIGIAHAHAVERRCAPAAGS